MVILKVLHVYILISGYSFDFRNANNSKLKNCAEKNQKNTCRYKMSFPCCFQGKLGFGFKKNVALIRKVNQAYIGNQVPSAGSDSTLFVSFHYLLNYAQMKTPDIKVVKDCDLEVLDASKGQSLVEQRASAPLNLNGAAASWNSEFGIIYVDQIQCITAFLNYTDDDAEVKFLFEVLLNSFFAFFFICTS